MEGRIWDEALAKLSARVHIVQHGKRAFRQKLAAYKVCAVSVLQFLGHFAPPLPALSQRESAALAAFLAAAMRGNPGPRGVQVPVPPGFCVDHWRQRRGGSP